MWNNTMVLVVEMNDNIGCLILTDIWQTNMRTGSDWHAVMDKNQHLLTVSLLVLKEYIHSFDAESGVQDQNVEVKTALIYLLQIFLQKYCIISPLLPFWIHQKKNPKKPKNKPPNPQKTPKQNTQQKPPKQENIVF